jgi:hypothetical protein
LNISCYAVLKVRIINNQVTDPKIERGLGEEQVPRPTLEPPPPGVDGEHWAAPLLLSVAQFIGL